MPTPPGLVAKLQALMNRIDAMLVPVERSRGRQHDRNYFDPLDVQEWFARWEAIRQVLVAEDKDLAYLPARSTPAVVAGTDYAGRGHVARSDVERLRRDMADAMDVLTHPSRQSVQVSLDREGVFVGGQSFDAMLAITSILRNAHRSIMLIDAYVSDDTLKLLSVKQDAVAASIMTSAKSTKPAFIAAAKAFNAQYNAGPPLEVRTTAAFHDRFIAIDETDYFHFGTSIMDAGKKNTFMFSRIEEPLMVANLKAEIVKQWAAASIVAL